MAKRLLMGNEAFAHAALEAGVGVVAGYPGTPSSELVETVARQCAKGAAEGVHVEWSTNEKAALEVAAAASMSGVRALFTCKQVGLNVASDALMSLNYVGVRGGLVLFVTDDPGPISSQTEQDTRRFAAFAKVPVLDPANPEQGYLMMKAAFDLSERFGTPVIVRPTTRISHASTFFDIEGRTQARPPLRMGDVPGGYVVDGSQGFVRDPDRWVIFPKRSYQAHGEILERLGKIAHTFCYDEQFSGFNPVFLNGKQVDGIVGDEALSASAKLGIVACGDSASYALEALSILRKESKRAGLPIPEYKFVQVGTPYPAPRRILTRFFKGLSDIIVFEELDSVIEEELLKIAANSFLAPTIHGKLTDEASVRGENSTEGIAMRIASFFDKCDKRAVSGAGAGDPSAAPEGAAESALAARRTAIQKRKSYAEIAERALGPSALYHYGKDLPPRPPVLCSGCPHRGSFYAVKRALSQLGVSRDDAVFCGDIGCYTLANAEPLDAVDTCLCMGAGITMAQGFAATNPSKKNIAFVGDSTFFASGLTGVANAVYNNHDITLFVLDNATTAMTGMQPHPGTGATLVGTQSAPLEIARILQALGVKSVHVADPLNRSAAEDASIKALKVQGPSAVIFQSPCIWLKRNDRVARVNIHKCTGCKKCITEVGCPAVGFDMEARGAKSGKRGQALIDPSQCNGCSLCAQVCPFQAIRVYKREELEGLERVKELDPSSASAQIAFGTVSEDAEVEGAPEASAAEAKAEGVAEAAEEGAEGAAAALQPQPGQREQRDPAGGLAPAGADAAAGAASDAATPDEGAGDAEAAAEDTEGAPEPKQPATPARASGGAADSLPLDALFGGQVYIDLEGGDE